MLYNKTVPQVLKNIRKKRHISQTTLAHYSHLTQNDLSKFENGKKDIRLSTLLRIARALDIVILPVPKDKVKYVQTLLNTEETGSSKMPITLLDKYGVSDEE